jgi:hypothetical protein
VRTAPREPGVPNGHLVAGPKGRLLDHVPPPEGRETPDSGRSRKEVIQPQVPLRLPCYDFTPVADPTVDGCLLCRLAHRLKVEPTPMV